MSISPRVGWGTTPCPSPPAGKLAGAATLLALAAFWLLGGGEAIAKQVRASTAEGEAAAQSSQSATVPFTLDHNRMTVEVEFVHPDGSARKARAWVDTGSQYLGMAETLARDLGLDVSGLERGARLVDSTLADPLVRLGGLPLSVEGVTTRVYPGAVVRPGVVAEASLGASLFRHDTVVFDYIAQKLTVARSGVLVPRGVRVDCTLNDETGLFMIAAIVDGDTVQLGVDTGSAGTWVSNALTALWSGRHPDWPQAKGAAGSANFFGFPFETEGVLMRVPEFEFGALHVPNVGLLGLDQSLFDWYSKKSAGPVSGFIGANVLKGFRLEVDFPNQVTYWQVGSVTEPGDFDIIGLTLRPEEDGSLTVAGVVEVAGKPAVEGVQSGDKLVRVDELDTATATMGDVVNALRGTPGSTHTLVVEREGNRLTVEAEVLRLP